MAKEQQQFSHTETVKGFAAILKNKVAEATEASKQAANGSDAKTKALNQLAILTKLHNQARTASEALTKLDLELTLFE